jgi:hypothetical protein
VGCANGRNGAGVGLPARGWTRSELDLAEESEAILRSSSQQASPPVHSSHRQHASITGLHSVRSPVVPYTLMLDNVPLLPHPSPKIHKRLTHRRLARHDRTKPVILQSTTHTFPLGPASALQVPCKVNTYLSKVLATPPKPAPSLTWRSTREPALILRLAQACVNQGTTSI